MRMFERLDRQFAGNQIHGEKCDFIGTALAIGLGVASAAGAIGSAAIGANAAGNAADAQVNAANSAAALQHQDAQDALAFQKQTYADQQKNLSPWLKTGTSAAVNLANLMGTLPKDVPATAGSPATPGVAAVPGHWDYADSGNPFREDFGIDSGNGTHDIGNGGTWIPGTPGAEGSPAIPASAATSSLQSLVNPSLGAEGSLAQDWTGKFVAPTDVTEQNDPGYAFRLAQGQKALENSASARGTLLSGGAAKEMQRYGQDYASNEYGNVYNRALGQYTLDYNTFKQNQADKYNRLASQSGMGQITAGQLGTAGQNASNNVSNILLTSGQQIGNNINNAGAARASGYIGSANAFGSAFNSLGNTASTLGLLSMLNKGGGASTAAGAWDGVI